MEDDKSWTDRDRQTGTDRKITICAFYRAERNR